MEQRAGNLETVPHSCAWRIRNGKLRALQADFQVVTFAEVASS